MRGVPRAGVILESLVMRNVVSLGDEHSSGRSACAMASSGPVGVDDCQIKATREIAPGRAGPVQQVADVFGGAEEAQVVAAIAGVESRLSVIDEREADRAVRYGVARGATHQGAGIDSVGITRDEVDHARARRAE